MTLQNFTVRHISLQEVQIQDSGFVFFYEIDGFKNRVSIQYEPNLLKTLKKNLLESAPNGQNHLLHFAANLGALGMHRFGSILPETIDFGPYETMITPAMIQFMNDVLPHEWSEHRYQLQRLDYSSPEIVYHPENSQCSLPIFQLKTSEDQNEKVFVASGSGKDSLLCSLLIQKAGIQHDLVTYLFDLYGDLDEQHHLFDQVNDQLHHDHAHVIRYEDDYYPWLLKRMKEHGINQTIEVLGREKPFRTEAGEMYFMSLALVPLQIVYQVPLQLFGNEKSADAFNMIDSKTGQAIAHQWPKSKEGEHAFSDLLLNLFQGMNRMSLTKALYDVRIFETLFRIGDELPYSTNSCNLQKPWCGSCEKCAYVFAGFAAFGDHTKVVESFGKDLFQDPALSHTWKELLGFYNYIPWECVGMHEEVQIYMEMIKRKGIQGIPIQIFSELNLTAKSLEEKAKRYGLVDSKHHQLPDWVWKKIEPILSGPDIFS